jgi:hypothetical protein
MREGSGLSAQWAPDAAWAPELRIRVELSAHLPSELPLAHSSSDSC